MILEPVFELHCCLCGSIIATNESPRYLIGSMAAECLDCGNQSKYDSKDDLVSAWAVCKEMEDETIQPVPVTSGVNNKAVTSDDAYGRFNDGYTR
jgi:ribosomal protein S27E